jgi:hypothetical protein
LHAALEGGNKSIYFSFGIVKGKRGPHSAWDSIEIHEGLGAVVSGSDSNALFV